MNSYISPVEGLITSRFDEPRPLSNPGQHIHGALDISAEIGKEILAPVDGYVSYYIFIRSNKKQSWDERINVNSAGIHLPWANYPYDIYGGVIIIEERESELVHLICHSYFNQLFNLLAQEKIICKDDWQYQEETKNERFPMMIFHTFDNRIRVPKGGLIGFVGNAGYSTGAHIHWEIHNGWTWTFYNKRVNPESLLR